MKKTSALASRCEKAGHRPRVCKFVWSALPSLLANFLQHNCTQLTGEVVLGLAMVALLVHLELVDSVQDAQILSDTLSSADALV